MTEQEFGPLFTQHRDAVYRFVWRMTNSTAAADDVTQDVFVILWRGEAGFDKKRGSVRAMLLGIARHLVWKRWRQDRRWCSLDEESFVASGLDVESLGVQEAVTAGITALPQLQREALILATYEELSLREIADATGVEVGTVKARLHRARENLKGMLAMYGKAEYGTAE